MVTATAPVKQRDEQNPAGSPPIAGPVPFGWRECTLTRATEIETLCNWVLENYPRDNSQVFAKAIAQHLYAARQAALAAKLKPRRRLRFFRGEALRERAISNLDAAEAALLNIAPADYVLGQLPSLLEHVQCHLVANDPRRLDFERIALRLGVNNKPGVSAASLNEHSLEDKRRVVEEERGKIASITRAASSAALREQIRVRSFRNVVVVTTAVLFFLAATVAFVGIRWPTFLPVCFAPEEAGQATVVCPTAQSKPFATTVPPAEEQKDIDDYLAETAKPADLLLVEGIGLVAAALAAAGSIRKIRGSSERYHLPVALTVLKLPTGAITAFLGLLLMRGQFVPGLSALDTSAQILAWAVVFGYAQQLFTRFVDRQGQTVLDSVRNADMPRTSPDPQPPPAERTG